ncbi:MAG TPA: T9SS type A sorting domain-containing protein [Bacteroidales bacterium]|nr:T9SS type A sorting domain-containing protein [Bacteroidales bacterium]
MRTRSTFQASTGWIASFLVCTGLLFASLTSSAQLTGTKTVGAGGDYATIEAAIADLNLSGVGGGGVTFNVAAGHTETLSSATAGTITATGTATDPIVFQKNGTGANPVITAFAWTVATANDGIIILAGCDYFTFDGIDLQENAANTSIFTDWGYALVKKQNTAPFDGCQYVTIKNCNITLNKANTSSRGIYSGNHIATATTSLTLTSAGDAMSNCTFENNIISNVYIGINLNGYNSTSYYDLNNTVTGNQINNFGGAGATGYGIYTVYNGDLLVSNNTVVGGTGTTTTLYGIACSTAASKNITISGNNVTVTGGATTSALYGISNSVGSTAAGNTVTISGNTVSNCTYPTATSGLFNAIVNSATAATVNIFNNNVNNNVLSGTGAFVGIYNSASMGTNPLNFYGNDISNNSKTGTSGTFYGCQAVTALISFYQNIISNNSVAGGSSAFYGYYNGSSPVTETYHSNQIYNLNHGGTGTTVGMQISTASGTKNVYNNQIYNLTSGGTVSGYASGYGAPTNFYNNRIYNLTSNSTSTTNGTVNGILITGGSFNVFNNYISQLYAPASASPDGIRGISITSTTSSTSHKIYYNTVYIDASSTGANFGGSGLYHTYSATATSSALDMRNNIIINNLVPAGTGISAAFRRSAATSLANISADCDNNCLYAGSPGTSNLIFYDGTNSDQTIADYQLRVAPRETASFSELPPFMNTSATPYDLHLTGSVSTSCEGGGQEIAGYTTDFDNDLRFGSTGYIGTGLSTDVGADEFEGTPNYTCLTPAPGNTLASDNNICLGKSVLLTIQNIPAGTGLSYQWQSSTDGITYTDINTANQVQLLVNPTGNAYYQCNITCLAGPATVASTPVLVSFANNAPVGTGANRCGTGTVTLSATGTNPSNTLTWYNSLSGGNIMGTGSSFTTPVISSTTNYYVAEESQDPGISVLGSGNSTSTGYQGPFYYSYGGEKSQYLIRASELQALGMVSGNITSIALDITSAGTTFTDLDVSIGTTSVTALSSAFETGLTSIYTDPAFTPIVGINTFIFTTPFYWDGASNLLINICWSNNDGGATPHSHVKYNTTSFVATNYYRVDNQPASYVCNYATRSGSYSSRPQFYINGMLLCSGPRTEVIATVTPPPAFSVSPDITVCPALITPISVTSNLNDYDTYIWDPVANLYLDAAATIPYTANTSATTVYFMTPGGSSTHTHTCTASNAALCANTDDVTITVMPAAPGVTASADELCFSGTTTLSVSPSAGYGAGTLQWQTSPDNVTFTDITGANGTTYLTPTLTSNTYYQLVIRDQNSTLCQQPWIEIVVNNPQILTTTPGTRCGIGTVDLEATASTGASIQWFTSQTGGGAIHTGPSYTTPVIQNTTDYYVSAGFGSQLTGGKPAPTLTTGTSLSNYGLRFDAYSDFTINTIDLYPATTAGTANIALYNNTATMIAGPVSVNFPAGNAATPFTANLGFNVPAGTQYRLMITTMSGGNLVRESSGNNWPYVNPTFSVTGGCYSSGGTSTSTSYYWFYNWNVTAGCFSPRTQVTATVTPPPALTATPDQTVCNDVVATIEVTSTLPDFDQYIWTPETHLYLDAACTTPYIAGTSATTLYQRTTTAGAYTYTCTATNLTSNCVNITTSKVTVKAPVLLNITANPMFVCPGDNAQLNVVATQAGLTPTWSYLWSPLDYITGQEALQNPLATAMLNTTQYSVLVTGDGCSATGNITVTVQAGPAITVQPVSTPGCDGGNASFNVTATGPGITYQWYFNSIPIDGLLNPSALTPSLILNAITPASAGTYEVLVSASCGTPVMSSPATLTVNLLPTIAIDPAPAGPVCAPHTLVSVTNATSPAYQWKLNGTDILNAIAFDYQLTLAGNYSVQVTDGVTQCQNISAAVPVAISPDPSAITITPNMADVCQGTILQLTAAGGIVPFPTVGAGTDQNTNQNYPTPYGAWFETSRQQYLILASELTAAGIQPGTPIPSIGFDVANLNGSGVHVNYTIKLAHTIVSVLTTTYETAGLITVFGPQDYYPVTGWNTHNFITPFVWDGISNLLVDICYANDPNNTGDIYTYNASVNRTNTPFNSVITSNADNTDHCPLATGTLSTLRPNMQFGIPQPVTKNWSPITGLYTDAAATLPYTGGEAPVVYALNGSGSYSYTYSSVSQNQCTTTGSAAITVNPLPTATTTLAATEYICPGDSKTLTVDLTGTPPWSLTVNDGTGPAVIPGIMTSPWTYVASPTIATTYTVTSVSDANCTNTSTVSVTVDIHPAPAPVITGNNSPICAYATTTLDAGAGYSSYLWSNQSTGQTLLVDGSVLGGNATALYTVTVTNQFGCEGSVSSTVTTFPVLSADAGQDAAICEGQSTQLDANGIGGGGTNQYAWSPAAGLSATGIKNPVANPVVTTTYTVTVTDNNNCIATDEVVITVYPAVIVDFTGLNAAYCIDAPVALLAGTPAGGTFSGPGIVGNTFDPVVAGVGGPYTITYTYTDGNNCIWSISKQVSVNPLPLVSYTGLGQAYCVDAATATLAGTPAGGTFSGPGISGSTFNPMNAGTGTHTITYTYTDGNNCTNSFSAQVTINSLPVVSFTGLNNLYCITAPISNLTGTPAGGTFTGPGIVGNTFDPVLAGVGGPYTITYTYTDGNNCTATFSLQTSVVQQLVASFTGLKPAFCLNEPAATLVGTPTGGIFSGQGISGNTFSPALAGVGGPYTITYTYSDGVACTSVTTQDVTIHPVPVVSYTGLNATYCASDAASALTGTPAGGTFSGNGISGNSFSPTAAGAGIYPITYTYTDGNSCTSSSTQFTEVFALPVLSMSPAAVICAGLSAPISVSASGAGGFIYQWNNAASLNNPAIAYPIASPLVNTTYTVTVTDGNLCQNTGSVPVTVNLLPVVSFTGLNSAYCVDAPAALLTGTPAGGTFAGPGITGNQFVPSGSGVGGPYTITYTYTDQNQCTNGTSATTSVNPLPLVTFTGLDPQYCINAPIANLTDNPAGGTFSGPGISGNQFLPSAAGVGNHQITYTYTDGNGCTNSKTMATVVDGLPVVTFTTLTQICVNASQISLSGGSPLGGTYSGPGVTAGTFNPNAAGAGLKTLTYTYTDGNNCTNFATHNIQVHALTPLSFPTLAGVCITEAPFALTNATPAGGIYSGPGVSAGMFDPNAAGAGIHTLTYTYTDGNNCTNSITQTIQVYALPNLVMSSNTSICIGASTQLGVTPFGGGGGYSFLWNNGTLLNSATISNPIATPVNTTTFTVTVTDIRGCKRTGSTTIMVNPLPALTLNPATDMCQGSNTQLNVQVMPAGTYTYNWNNGATLSSTSVANPVAAPVVTTTYTVTVTNPATSCVSTAQTVVTVLPNPVPAITGLNANYCVSAAPVTLTGNPAGGVFTINGVPALQLDPAVVGVGGHTVTYQVTQANNCVASTSLGVNVRALPIADAGQDQSVCTGFQVNLSASASAGAPPYQYLWSPAALVSNPNIANPATNPTATTTYTVVVTDLYGCSSSDAVVVNTTSTPVANAGLDVTICKGQGTQLQASGGTTYAWVPSTGLSNPNISDPIASPAVTTTYSVIVVSNCGIAADQVVVNVLPLPNVDFTGLPANACLNGSPITLTGIPAGGLFSGPGVTGNVFDPAQAGGPGVVNISYTITGSNGCDNTITKSVHVRPVTAGTINNLAPLYCASGNAVILSGIPSGGTFAGPGMAGNTFNPAMAGVGVHTIIYTFSDQYGCLSTITQQTTVYAPAVNITNLAPDYCVNGAAVTLTGTPSGGIFSGNGMNGAKFVPSVAGVGTHNITYWAQDGNSCWGTTTLSTVVLPPTPVSFTGLAPTYCTNDAIATLTGSPAGGTFSGPGIVGNTFNPATSSTGTRVIWYTVSGPGFCKNSVTQSTVVSSVPAVSFSGLNPSYCVSALPVNLTFAPAGGTFSGAGITGNVFTPAAAGVGNHTITYSFTSAAGCTNAMTRNTQVIPLLVVSFSGLNATYCINDGPALLTGSPAGGYFNGPGIQYGIYFNPTLAGLGTHTINYTYKDVNQCTNVASATVTVTALPTATFQIPAGVCIDAAPVTLAAIPAGGTFAGPGVVNGIFFPNLAGTGIHTLSYSLTNTSGCGGTLTTTIQVYALPSVTISYVKTNHCDNAVPVTLAGNPAGGTFTGNGMIGNVFHPALAGVGTHIITYTYTNANGCTKSATRTLNVIPAPVVSFTGLASSYCINEPTVTLTGTPAGGYFSGPGAGLASFSPLSAGAGTHTITYTLSLNGCTSTASQQVTVNPLPVLSFVNVPSSYCINQGPLTLNATPAGGTFTFSGNGLTGNVLDPAVAGVGGYNLFYAYTDPVTGCSRTIKAVIYIRPVSASTLIGPATVCQSGAPVIISGSPATPAGTYTGPGMTGNLFNPGVAGAGTHTITYHYTNGFGCVTTANHSIAVLAGPALTLPQTTTVCNNQTTTLTADSGATSYQWSTGATTQSIVVDGAILGAGTHNISVTATNAQGCSTTAVIQVIVQVCKVGSTAAEPSVTVYPNPSSGAFNLILNNFTGTAKMSIYNEIGQLLSSETLQFDDLESYTKSVDLSRQPAGVYTVKLTNDRATRAIKLILQ